MNLGLTRDTLRPMTADPALAYDTFTKTCKVCGGTVQVEKSVEQPHRCRIDLDAQKGQKRA